MGRAWHRFSCGPAPRKKTRRLSFGKVGVALAFLIVVTAAGPPAAPAAGLAAGSTPRVELSETGARPGGVVGVRGFDFRPGEAVDLFFDRSPVARASTDTAGDFALVLPVPAGAPGTHWLTALGSESDLAAQAPFAVRHEWPQYRHDAAHTAFASDETVLDSGNVSQLGLAWSIASGNPIFSPALANGNVYMSGFNGEQTATTLFTLHGPTCGDPAGCPQEWSALGPYVFGWEPAVADDTMYVSSQTGQDPVTGAPTDADYLYAFPTNCGGSAPCGTVIWKARIGPGLPCCSPPTVAGSRVFVSSDKTYAFAAGCGSDGAICTPLWSTEPAGEPSAPAVADGRVFVSSSDGVVNAYAADCGSGGATCSPLWSAAVGPHPSSPAVADGVVYVAGDRLYAFPADCGAGGATCSPLWTGAIERDPVVTVDEAPAVGDGRVFVAASRLYAFPTTCPATTCAPAWSLAGGRFGAPIVANNVVFVVRNNELIAVAADCGSGGATCLPLLTAADSADGPLEEADGVIYFEGGEHQLFAYCLSGVCTSEQPRPDPATLRPAAPSLLLEPAAAQANLGTQRAVTATLTDAGAPIAGAQLLVAVTGANSLSTVATTGPDGRAVATYWGARVGTDTLTVCYDRTGDGSCQADEPQGSATTEWVSSGPRTCLGRTATNNNTPGAGGDVLIGTPGSDTIDGLGGDDLICGRADQDTSDLGDTLSGGGGSDIIFGDEGGDTIYGYRAGGDNPADGIEDGNDRLHGGPGSDTIQGGPGNDQVFGDDGNDHNLFGDDPNFGEADDGNDFVSGGPGNDGTLRGGGGNDVILGGAGNDNDLLGGSGNDRVDGGDGNDDDLSGQRGNDVVNGGNGDDTNVDGGEGNDLVTGGNGNDTLFGSLGDDTLVGGPGLDSADGDLGLDPGPGVDTCQAEIEHNCG
jgi:hypothetical protein